MKMSVQVKSETRAAILVLHKVKYSFRKTSVTLESTQTPAIIVFWRPTSKTSNSLVLRLMDYSIHGIFKRRF